VLPERLPLPMGVEVADPLLMTPQHDPLSSLTGAECPARVMVGS
jgi:hypothetical protein